MALIIQAFRYELDPNDVQETQFRKAAGTARFAWNWALANRLEILAKDPSQIGSAIEDHRRWNAWKHENAPWACEVTKCAPQEALRDLYRAFSLWRNARNRATPIGMPRFKKKGARDAFRLTGQIHVFERSIQLPTFGRVRTKERTDIDGRILSATVRREADRWFVSLTVERDREILPQRTGTVVGIDLGLRPFAMLSDGERVEGSRPLEKALSKVRLLSKRHRRKAKGSRNRDKAALKLSKLFIRIRNQRSDFLNKLTTRLAKTKPVIVIENLNTRRLIRNKILSRSIADAAWGELERKLTYKSRWYGATLIVASRNFPSTRRCSSCGVIVDELPRDLKKWTCDACGTPHDRDLNAAQNLAAYGTASWAETTGVSRKTPVDDSSGGGTAWAGLRVSGRRSRKRTKASKDAG